MTDVGSNNPPTHERLLVIGVMDSHSYNFAKCATTAKWPYILFNLVIAAVFPPWPCVTHTQMVTFADDQLIKSIWLAGPGCYLPS